MRRNSAFNLRLPDGVAGKVQLFDLPESVEAAVIGTLRDLGIEGTAEEIAEGLGNVSNLVPANVNDLGDLLGFIRSAATRSGRKPRGTELVTAYIETMEITIDPCDIEAADKLGTAAGRFAARALAALEEETKAAPSGD